MNKHELDPLPTDIEQRIATAEAKARAARAEHAACCERNHEGSLDPAIAVGLDQAVVAAKSALRVLDRDLARLLAEKGVV